jgi:hypothetical protein
MTHRRDKILLLVDGWDVRLVRLLADHLNANTQLVLSNNTQKATLGEDWPRPRRACVYCLVERLTGILSGYFCLIRSASALRFSTLECISLRDRRRWNGKLRSRHSSVLLTKGMLIFELGTHSWYSGRVCRAKLAIGFWGARMW